MDQRVGGPLQSRQRDQGCGERAHKGRYLAHGGIGETSGDKICNGIGAGFAHQWPAGASDERESGAKADKDRHRRHLRRRECNLRRQKREQQRDAEGGDGKR